MPTDMLYLVRSKAKQWLFFVTDHHRAAIENNIRFSGWQASEANQGAL